MASLKSPKTRNSSRKYILIGVACVLVAVVIGLIIYFVAKSHARGVDPTIYSSPSINTVGVSYSGTCPPGLKGTTVASKSAFDPSSIGI